MARSSAFAHAVRTSWSDGVGKIARGTCPQFPPRQAISPTLRGVAARVGDTGQVLTSNFAGGELGIGQVRELLVTV